MRRCEVGLVRVQGFTLTFVAIFVGLFEEDTLKASNFINTFSIVLYYTF